MFTNILYGVDIPSEFPQHSETEVCLCVTQSYIVQLKDSRVNLCSASQTNQSEVFKLIAVL